MAAAQEAREDVTELCASLQDDELTVLESIYPDQVKVLPNPLNKPGRLLGVSIPVALSSPLQADLIIQHDQPSSSAVLPAVELSHLPLLSLRLHLPSTYPIESPPKTVSLRADLSDLGVAGSWLSRSMLVSLQSKFDKMWTEEKEVMGEGTGVIWKWYEWVKNGDFSEELGMMAHGRLQLAVPPGVPPSTFHTLLKTHNAKQLHSSFESTAFSCSICIENRKGKSCIKMPTCDCVFCTPCLSSCWSLAIEEGTLENVSCPSVSCVKRRATGDAAESMDAVRPELVEEVVGAELRQRWAQLKEKRKAEIDPSYTICPRPSCQAAVPPPPLPSAADIASQAAISRRAIRLADITNTNSSALDAPPEETKTAPTDDRWARYRICPACSYSFCLYCTTTWHGPHTPCAFPQTSALVLEYLSYPEGSSERRAMEARKGKSNIDRMVAKWHEDEENRKWLESRTRPCSGCGVRVEKSHGCNHMTCGRCKAHFCYRCGSSISPQDPYAHYRRPGHACYMRLFDQEEIERFERETAAGVGGVALGDEVEVDWRDVRGIWDAAW